MTRCCKLRSRKLLRKGADLSKVSRQVRKTVRVCRSAAAYARRKARSTNVQKGLKGKKGKKAKKSKVSGSRNSRSPPPTPAGSRNSRASANEEARASRVSAVLQSLRNSAARAEDATLHAVAGRLSSSQRQPSIPSARSSVSDNVFQSARSSRQSSVQGENRFEAPNTVKDLIGRFQGFIGKALGIGQGVDQELARSPYASRYSA